MDLLSIFGIDFIVKLFIIPTILGFLFIFRYIITYYFKNKYILYLLYSFNILIWIVILKLLFNQIVPSSLQNFLIGDISLVFTTIIIHYMIETSYKNTRYTIMPTLITFFIVYLYAYSFKPINIVLVIMSLILFGVVIQKIIQNKKYINNHPLLTYPIIALFINISIFLIYGTVLVPVNNFSVKIYSAIFLPTYFFQIYAKVLILLFIGKIVFSTTNTIVKEYNLLKTNVYIDELTQVFNRRKFELVIEELVESKYISQFSLVIFDVDSFKAINDNWGHDAGDYILKNIILIIKKRLKESENQGQLFRYGGDEFFLIFRHNSGEEAKEIMIDISKEIYQFPFEYRGNPLKTSISSGVLEISSKMNYNDILYQVDKKLYQAKYNGKNQVYY